MSLLIRVAVLALAPVVFAGLASAQTCSFSVTPTTRSFGAEGGDGTFTITGTSGCSRDAASNVPWITITFGASGTGSGSAGYHVNANGTTSARTGTVTVGGAVHTVTQAAGTCGFALNPASANVGASGGSGTFTVTSECNWTAATSASWVTLSGVNGTGNGVVGWTADANNTSNTRNAQITVGTATFMLSQRAANCTFSVSNPPGSVTGNGTTLNLTVTSSSTGCDRQVTSSVPWITITSGASGTGGGTVALTIQANPGSTPRSGTVAINGTTVATIFQLAGTCTYTLNPTTGTATQTGGTGTFAVQTQAGCTWSATSQTDWISVSSGSSGTGAGTVTYSVGQNLTSDTRSGYINVGSALFVVSQAGLGCSVRVENIPLVIGSEGGTSSITVSSLAGCNWKASTAETWIKITAGGSGSGVSDVAFEVAPNPTINTRTGYITVGDFLFRITQGAAQCKVALSGSTGATIPAGGGTGTVPIAANCQWNAASSADWIQITSPPSGTADATLTYQVPANTTSDERTGKITVNGQAFTITQPGQRCNLSLSATSASLPARGGSGSVSVTGGSACNWSPTGAASWLRVEYASVSGSGTVRFFADPNTSGSTRTTSVSVSGQTISIQQAAIVLMVDANNLVNAASFANAGVVSPGEIITIFGSGFGPVSLTTLQLTTNRQNITNAIGDTRVLFDDVPSPMVYVVEGQLSAIVPYAIAGKTTTVMQVEYLGVRSNAVTLQVAATVPGLFTTASNGKGQAAVLNQDNTLNGPGSAGAARNSVIQIFATGEGQTNPNGVDGKLTVAPIPGPRATVRVTIGGVDSPVTFSGGAPGLVAGLVQINARVPATVTPGDQVPIVVRIGEVESQPGVTIGVR